MKTVAVFLFSVLLGLPVFAKDINVTVKGMVCAFCAQGITKKFKAQPEIESVNVSLATKVVALKTKDKMDLSDEKIRQILTDAGYNIESIQRP